MRDTQEPDGGEGRAANAYEVSFWGDNVLTSVVTGALKSTEND